MLNLRDTLLALKRRSFSLARATCRVSAGTTATAWPQIPGGSTPFVGRFTRRTSRHNRRRSVVKLLARRHDVIAHHHHREQLYDKRIIYARTTKVEALHPRPFKRRGFHGLKPRSL